MIDAIRANELALSKRKEYKEDRFTEILKSIEELASKGVLSQKFNVLDKDADEFKERLIDLKFKVKIEERDEEMPPIAGTIIIVKRHYLDVDWSQQL